MDITCGITFNTDSTTMAQLESALLRSNYDEIEKFANKLRKKKELSFETVLECYVGIHRQVRLHAASFELDLSHLMAYQIKIETVNKITETLKKVLMETDGSDLELKLAYVLLGMVTLFSFQGKESLTDSLAYFDKIDFDLSKKFLLYEQGDTEITQSSLIEKIFGIVGLYFRGIALELQGRKEDACEQYQIITDFLFRFRLLQFTQAKSVYDFICASLYRSGCLLNQLAQFKDSAAIFRSFLSFFQVNPSNQKRHPPNSTVRLLRALSQYLDLLDRNFRRYNFKTFCDESGQYQISGNHRDTGQLWQAENVQEEMTLCCMLLKSIDLTPAIVKQSYDDLKVDVNVLRRFARIGYLEGISRIQKLNFQTIVANLNIYRNLFHTFMASGKTEQAILSAKMYLQGHGNDQFTLLLISKLYISLPSKIDEAFNILDRLLDCEELEIGMQIPYFLLRGQYLLIKSHQQTPFDDGVARKNFLARAEAEFQLVLQVDDRNAEALYFSSLIAAESENFELSERQVKRSLSMDSSQIKAWNAFALLKSVKKDYEAVLNICNTELSNMIYKDMNLSLLKVSTLLALNRSDEAIETLKKIISAHFRKSNDLRMDGGMTVISEGTLGPGNFLSKFLGDQNGSIYEYEGTTNSLFINENLMTLTTFQEYTQSFPSTLDEYLIGKNEDFGGIGTFLRGSIDIKDLKKIFFDRMMKGNCGIVGGGSGSAVNFVTSSLWIEVSRVYLHEGLLQDAQSAVNQAYQTNEIFAPIFGAFGLIEEAHGNFNFTSDLIAGGAESFYRKGLSIDFEDEICLMGLSRLLIKSKSPKNLFEAEILIRRLIQKDHLISEAWSLLAQCCGGTERQEEALKYFKLALKKESKTPLRSFRSLSIP